MISYLIVLIIVILVLLALPGYIELYREIKMMWFRYRIGKHNGYKIWKNKLVVVANKWMIKMPNVPIHSTARFLYFSNLRRHSSDKVQSWQLGGLLLGIFSEIDNDMDVKKVISLYIDSKGCWKMSYDSVDSAIIAYAILVNAPNTDVIFPAMKDMFLMLKGFVGSDGTVTYTDKTDSRRYVDTIGMICPFLVAYAKTYSDDEALRLAKRQIEEYELNGFIENSLLPFHGYDIITREPIGLIGWGRGLGWYLLGLIDIIDVDNKSLPETKDRIRRIADDLARYQKQDGGFGSIIQYKTTYDSSATAIIGLFYAKCYDLFDSKRDLNIAKGCLRKLMSVTRRNGIVDYSQGDTPSLGVYSTRLDEMPFTQGIALRLANILKDEI